LVAIVSCLPRRFFLTTTTSLAAWIVVAVVFVDFGDGVAALDLMLEGVAGLLAGVFPCFLRSPDMADAFGGLLLLRLSSREDGTHEWVDLAHMRCWRRFSVIAAHQLISADFYSICAKKRQ